MNAVGAVCDFAVARKIAVFNLHLIQMRCEVGDRRDAESEVNFDVPCGIVRAAPNDMELLMRTNTKPDVVGVLKRMRNTLEAEEFFVKVCAPLQIANVDSGVIEFRGFAGKDQIVKRAEWRAAGT